jgi:hypothetical protein
LLTVAHEVCPAISIIFVFRTKCKSTHFQSFQACPCPSSRNSKNSLFLFYIRFSTAIAAALSTSWFVATLKQPLMSIDKPFSCSEAFNLDNSTLVDCYPTFDTDTDTYHSNQPSTLTQLRLVCFMRKVTRQHREH